MKEEPALPEISLGRQVTNYRFNQNSSWTGREEENKREKETLQT